MRLDARDKFPSGMEEYLAKYGWHFSKKMCDWVTSNMYKKDDSGKKIPIDVLDKNTVDTLLARHGISLENKFGYDYVFVANMCKADYLGSSITDERHLALFVKDYVDDPDGYPELPFTRFYGDSIGLGLPINWEDMI
jgi:hypothetical protein